MHLRKSGCLVEGVCLKEMKFLKERGGPVSIVGTNSI